MLAINIPTASNIDNFFITRISGSTCSFSGRNVSSRELYTTVDDVQTHRVIFSDVVECGGKKNDADY
jgi:hypothetical protein